MPITFCKYHGLGNDFIIVDNDKNREVITPTKAIQLCNRNFGVGADGVLVISPSKQADIKMDIFNSDGSQPQMCGNGIRCAVKFALDTNIFSPQPDQVSVETGRGVLTCVIDGDSVTAKMGRPIFECDQIPIKAEGQFLNQPITCEEYTFNGYAVSMGNPHLVIFALPKQKILENISLALSQHPWFPEQTNVEFCQVIGDNKLKVIVFERGCGFTLACGTGACATVAAAGLKKVVDPARPVKVELPGGELLVEIIGDYQDILMTGPANLVFRGETN